MLTEFALKNFKALKDVSLSLGRINVLIGPNGTGKSSVLQALALLKQSIGELKLVTSGEALDLGNYEDIVHRRMKETPIEFRLVTPVCDVRVGPKSFRYVARFKEAVYDARFDRSGLHSHRLHVGGLDPGIVASWGRVAGAEVRPREVDLRFGTMKLDAPAEVGRGIQISGWSLLSGVDESTAQAARAAFNSVFMAIESVLRQTYVIPPIRGFDKPAYPLQQEPVDDFFTARGPEEQASHVLSTIAYRRELEEAISEFSERALGLRMRVKLIPDKRVSAEAYNGSGTNLVNEGFGANQLMVLLAQMVIAPEDSLLGIEEPEIHLHPRAQAALAEIFVEFVTSQRKQVILTTHNEHILMGLLTQVARGRLNAEDLRIYYFEKDNAGAANAELLELDGRGRLKGGLKGFFEANIGELENYLQAVSKPRTG